MKQTWLQNFHQLPHQTLIVWDSCTSPGTWEGPLVSWASSSLPRPRSLIGMFDDKPDELRDLLQECRIDLIKTLGQGLIGPRLASFWMNPLIEGSPYKDSGLIDLLRIVALRSILKASETSCVAYLGPNRRVARAVRELSEEMGIDFVEMRVNGERRKWSYWRPHRLLAIVAFSHYAITRWPLRRASGRTEADLAIVTYLAHVDWVALEEGRLVAPQLGGLRTEVLGDHRVDWYHHYISTDGPRTRKSSKLLNRLTIEADDHQFFDGPLSARLLVHSLLSLIQSWLRSPTSRVLKERFGACGRTPEWTLVRDVWRDGSIGKSRIRNEIAERLAQSIAERAKPETPLLLLWENQPWERALSYYWRSVVKGPVLGFAHTSIPFWCIPYFDGALVREFGTEYESVSPDLRVVTGDMALKSLRRGGVRTDNCFVAEALRYQDLADLRQTMISRGPVEGRRLLVLGEIREEPTIHLVSSVVEACDRLADGRTITFRAHPASGVCLPSTLASRVVIHERDLKSALGTSDVVIASAGTSALLDAASAGLRVASFLSPVELDLSPLVGHESYHSLSSVEDLVAFISDGGATVAPKKSEIFCLDPTLTRWKSLLFERASIHVPPDISSAKFER